MNGTGDPHADLFIVGEGPGATEDKLGKPFVGAAGKVLDDAIERFLGLSREDVYISNTVRCRPPNNRKPTDIEADTCTDNYLYWEIGEVQPKFLLCLGSTAMETVMGLHGSGISKAHGRIRTLDFDGIVVKAMATFHPAALIYNKDYVELFRQDFENLKLLMEEE
jgi:DNA polymerase